MKGLITLIPYALINAGFANITGPSRIFAKVAHDNALSDLMQDELADPLSTLVAERAKELEELVRQAYSAAIPDQESLDAVLAGDKPVVVELKVETVPEEMYTKLVELVDSFVAKYMPEEDSELVQIEQVTLLTSILNKTVECLNRSVEHDVEAGQKAMKMALGLAKLGSLMKHDDDKPTTDGVAPAGDVQEQPTTDAEPEVHQAPDFMPTAGEGPGSPEVDPTREG